MRNTHNKNLFRINTLAKKRCHQLNLIRLPYMMHFTFPFRFYLLLRMCTRFGLNRSGEEVAQFITNVFNVCLFS